MGRTPEIPGWVTLLAIVVTAAMTTWAMAATGNSRGWSADPNQAYVPRDVTRALSPGVAALDTAMAGPGRPGSATFTMVGARRAPMLFVPAPSSMPHDNRGICSGCHQITVGNARTSPITGSSSPGPAAGPSAPFVPTAAAPRGAVAVAPTEGSWLGMEVAPITDRRRARYGLADGIAGVVVVEAEALAALAGVRAGDVVLAVDGTAVGNLTDFMNLTHNGSLAAGTIETVRAGQRLQIPLGLQSPAGPG